MCIQYWQYRGDHFRKEMVQFANHTSPAARMIQMGAYCVRVEERDSSTGFGRPRLDSLPDVPVLSQLSPSAQPPY